MTPEQAMQDALEQCANEAIHQIGQIQPHGILLVTNNNTNAIILQSSINLNQHFRHSPDAANGLPLETVIGPDLFQQISQELNQSPLLKELEFFSQYTLYDKTVFAAIHIIRAQDYLIIEIIAEDKHEPPNHDDNLASINLLSINNINEDYFFQSLAAQVRAFTHYDNVMIYKFDANWDGEVIAQSRINTSPDYLGQHFPASDIPPQARELYTKNLVRGVVDIDANNAYIMPTNIPNRHEKLDLTHSFLRSVSPIHVQYLRNMGVKATLTISLLQNGRLWGLIACHHPKSKSVTTSIRSLAANTSKLISEKLSEYEHKKHESIRTQLNGILCRLQYLSASTLLDVPYNEDIEMLVKIMNADGLIMIDDTTIRVFPENADHSLLARFAQKLNALTDQNIFCSYNLENYFNDLDQAITEQIAGCLILKYGKNADRSLIWTRKPKSKSVSWAGQYAQGLEKTLSGNYRLSPRKSFAIWTEEWQNKCEYWSYDELNYAQYLSDQLNHS